MKSPKIQLISFNLCPFVQRSIITLNKKGIDYDVTYIDLQNKPSWFLAISPLGKVPVLQYGDDVLFESAVINEFLDEIHPPQLLARIPLAKAKQRAWIEYLSQVTMNQYLFMVAQDVQRFDEQCEALKTKLQRLETLASSDNYFNGEQFTLIDSALAPILTRFAFLKQHFSLDLLNAYPKLSKISQHLLAKSYVKESTVDNFDLLLKDYLADNNSYLLQQH